jgi:hypothetical protein
MQSDNAKRVDPVLPVPFAGHAILIWCLPFCRSSTFSDESIVLTISKNKRVITRQRVNDIDGNKRIQRKTTNVSAHDWALFAGHHAADGRVCWFVVM